MALSDLIQELIDAKLELRSVMDWDIRDGDSHSCEKKCRRIEEAEAKIKEIKARIDNL
jgi:hypothetical protein